MGLDFVGIYKSLPTDCTASAPYIDNQAFRYLNRVYPRTRKNIDDVDARFDFSKPLCCRYFYNNFLRRQVLCATPLVCDRYGKHISLRCPKCHFTKLCRYRERNNYKFIWRNIYAPCVVYKVTPNAISDSFHYRIALARGGSLHEDMNLFKNQENSCKSSKTYNEALRMINVNLQLNGKDPLTDAIDYTLDSSHPKFRLRKETLSTLLESGFDPLTYEIKDVTAKEKVEWAKYGKFMRQIVDLSCEGSLLGGAMAKDIKKCFDCSIRWCFVGTPNLNVLQTVFKELCETTSIYYAFFSDDSCIGLRCSDGHFLANMDIKCADGSAGVKIFDSLLQVTAGTQFHEVMKNCVEQCRKPLKLSNPFFNYYMTAEPLARPILYSGSVLTTLVNNFGNLLIYSVIQDWLDSLDCLPSYAEVVDKIPHLARLAGYNVTLDICRDSYDLQLLKFSPGSYDYIPYLNLGPILRAIGSSDGDLPGKLSDELCDNRDRDIVAGLVHAGDHFLTECLREMFPTRGKIYNKMYVLSNLIDCSLGRAIDEEFICKRYNISKGEITDFVSQLRKLKIGYSLDHKVSRNIYTKDYGYVYDS